MNSRMTRRLFAATSLSALLWTGSALAATDEERGIDPNQGQSLVELTLPNKGAAMRLQLDAEKYGIEFNDHYLGRNADGSVRVHVFGDEADLDRLEAGGYAIDQVLEGPRTWKAQAEQRKDAIQSERSARSAAEGNVESADTEEVVILRADYFKNYAGQFLSIEAKTRKGGVDPVTNNYAGPTLAVSYDTAGDGNINSTPELLSVNEDPDTTPDTYIEHRGLFRLNPVDGGDVAIPTKIRVGSSTGESREGSVSEWLAGGLPPMADTYLSDFTTRYVDPTEAYAKLAALQKEFPNISELITLPNKTNGYQRKAQANMEGTLPIGNSPATTAQAGRTVVLTSRAWGHEGGNDITAEFVNPGVANAPLAVEATGKDILVKLATDAAGAPKSTVANVVAAINGHPAASQLVVAQKFRNFADTGIVAPRQKVNLSDFLSTTTNAHVKRGQFEYSVMRIGKHRDGSKVGVFLYCQQHAREWATVLTCLETAEQLLRNYAIDPATRELVDNLDIFILPSANPDGAHYSMHNFTQQRRNLTNHCVVGGKVTDNAFGSDFWSLRTNPGTGQPYVNNDPASRNAWGVDLNRNNTVGTLFDGYIGASHSCTSDTYTGPAEASEPEIRNEHWVADTFDNIKFSNNIHSYGGYFMWAPGAYLPDRSEGPDGAHANIGIEKYFFAAGDKILNRIKEIRNTVILPERTGPIADVLYSAAGNSADEHWYKRGVIAYSFETGADVFGTTLAAPVAAGATQVRLSNRTGFQVGDKITFNADTPKEQVRTITAIAATNPPAPAPNVTLDAPLTDAHDQTAFVRGGRVQSIVTFQPHYATEGKFEALEFAAGNRGLLESALDYSNDVTPPEVRMTGPESSRQAIRTTFEFVNEPSVIYYTTDNTKPTTTVGGSVKVWDSTGPREPGESFLVTKSTHFRWLAVDIKGNQSQGHRKFNILPGKE